MTLDPSERLGLFIDGPNFALACRDISFNPDFNKVLLTFYPDAAVYVTAKAHAPGLVTFLSNSGWQVVTRPSGNMDVELALEMVKRIGELDHMVLFSGDGDFTCLVKYLQERGVKVTVVSGGDSANYELVHTADVYINIKDITHQIQRDAR